METQTAFAGCQKNSGFVIGLVLVAIVLLSAVTAAFALSGSYSQPSITAEEKKLHVSSMIQQASVIRTAIRRYAINVPSFPDMQDLYDADLVSTSLTISPKAFNGPSQGWHLGTVTFLSSGRQYQVIILPGIHPDLVYAINSDPSSTLASAWKNLYNLISIPQAYAASSYMAVIRSPAGTFYQVTQSQVENFLGHPVTGPEDMRAGAQTYAALYHGVDFHNSAATIEVNAGSQSAGAPPETSDEAGWGYNIKSSGNSAGYSALSSRKGPRPGNTQPPSSQAMQQVMPDAMGSSLGIRDAGLETLLNNRHYIGYQVPGSEEAYFIAQVF